MNLTCEVTKEDLDLLCSPEPAVNHSDGKSDKVTATGGPRVLYNNKAYNMMEAAGPQEVHKVHCRCARRPDVSGSHSRSISDPIRSSWFLPCREAGDSKRLFNAYLYIFPSFPGVCYAPSCLSQWTNPRDIAYISVSKSTPLTVTDPYGPLASLLLGTKIMCSSNNVENNYIKKLKADRPHPRNFPHMPTGYRPTDKHLRLVMTPIALYCTRQSRAPNIDRCALES